MTEQTLVGSQGNTETNTTTNPPAPAAPQTPPTTQTPPAPETNNKTLIDGQEGEEKPPGEQTQTPPPQEDKPIEYTDFTLPDGMKLDDEFATEFKGIAQKLKLNQEQAQDLVSLQSKFVQGYAAKQQEDFNTQVNGWKQESLEFLGADHKGKLQKVARAMESYGSPELRELLNITGLGNHKAIVGHFLELGEKVSEGKMPTGNDGGAKPKSLAERMYQKK